MAIDFNTTPFLFSVGTLYSYKINKKFYGNIHYVWCTTYFNEKSQPVTSNPLSICKRYIDVIVTEDRHAIEISNNKAGILRGAQAKLDANVINKREYKDICQLVNVARFSDFYPVLYIINAKKVGKRRCKEVKKKNKANDKSIEYIIEDLSINEFELIDFRTLVENYLNVTDAEVGK